MNYTNKLKQAARKAMKKAYAPYSKYCVGAAVLTDSGKIYTGCNIENGSYGLTICAERAAFFNAIIDGHRKFKAIAVTANATRSFTASCIRGSKTASNDILPYPCGACLQVMTEFAPDITIIIFGSTGKTEIRKIKDLLPSPFKSAKLKC